MKARADTSSLRKIPCATRYCALTTRFGAGQGQINELLAFWIPADLTSVQHIEKEAWH